MELKMTRTTNQNFAYSFGILFVIDAGVNLPRKGWSAAHSLQGFSRGPGCIQIATLTQYGLATLNLVLGRYLENSKYERVIEVPLEVNSGAIEVFTVDTADSSVKLVLEPGPYKIVVAQQLLEQEQDPEDGAGKELIEIYFEKLSHALDTSRILTCDDGLRPPSTLLETLP
jgi:hypothetical protein